MAQAGPVSVASDPVGVTGISFLAQNRVFFRIPVVPTGFLGCLEGGWTTTTALNLVALGGGPPSVATQSDLHPKSPAASASIPNCSGHIASCVGVHSRCSGLVPTCVATSTPVRPRPHRCTGGVCTYRWGCRLSGDVASVGMWLQGWVCDV